MMDNEKLYDFLLAAGKPMTIGQINSSPEFKDVPRQELAQGLQQLSAENIAFRSVRQGKAYYSADPAEGVSRNPCQRFIGDMAGAMNQALFNMQNPQMAQMGQLFRTMDQLMGAVEEGGAEPSYAFTYHDGIVAQGDGYTIAIPDGFKLEQGKEDRDFVAWLPGAESDAQEDARIVIYAGQLNPGNFQEIDAHRKTAESFGILCRCALWGMKERTDAIFGANDMKEIPLTGEVCGGYLYNSHNYQAMVGFPNGIKMLRILAQDEGCTWQTYHDQIVSWIGTLKLKEPFPVLEPVNSDKFLPLTKQSISAWKQNAQHHVERTDSHKNAMAQERVARFQCEKGGSVTLLKKDLRAIMTQFVPEVEGVCTEVAAFLQRAGAEDGENPLLLDVYNIARSLFDKLTVEITLDEEPIQVVSARRGELLQLLEIPAITAMKEAEEKRKEEERRRKEEERRRKEEERKRIEAEKKAEEERRRAEEAQKRRLEELRLRKEVEQMEAERLRKEEEARIAAEKAAAEKRAAEEAAAREREERRRQKRARFARAVKRFFIGLLIAIVVVAVSGFVTIRFILPAIENSKDYKQAQSYLAAGYYDDAESAFRALGDYKDAADMTYVSRYRKAESLLQQGSYAEAIAVWESLGSYADSADRAVAALDQWRGPDYQKALELMEAQDYLAAAALFETLDGYRDSAGKIEECKQLHLQARYAQAQQAQQTGDYPTAMKIYKELGDYGDSRQQYTLCAYDFGVQLLQEKAYADAIKYLDMAGSHGDAAKLKTEATYGYGIQLLESGKYENAIKELSKCASHADAADRIKEAKFGYVKANLKRDNATTRTYLKELVDAGYNGAQKLYDELYAWKVEIIAFSNSPYSHVNQSTLSKYQGMFCHFKVTGGEPGARINLKAHVTAPNGQKGTLNFNSCSDGSIWYTQFAYDNPYYGATGTMSVKVVDAASGRTMASGSVKVTN